MAEGREYGPGVKAGGREGWPPPNRNTRSQSPVPLARSAYWDRVC